MLLPDQLINRGQVIAPHRPGMLSADARSGSKSGDHVDDDEDSDNGPMDPKELAAETQRILRGERHPMSFAALAMT